MKYAYRLKNYENEWTETLPGEHTARYNFIPSGKYVFQVRATDEKGHWSDKITEVKVTITPYFYKSWWFYLLLAILITVGSYYFYQWKISLYRQQKKQLEKEVAQRTHELELQNKTTRNNGTTRRGGNGRKKLLSSPISLMNSGHQSL